MKYFIKHPWISLITWIIVIAFIFTGLSKLTLVNDYKVFFSEDNKDLIAYEAIENKYNANDSVLIIVAPENGTVFQPDILETVQRLTQKAWNTPFSYRVDSITNYQASESHNDDIVVDDFIQKEELSDLTLLDNKLNLAINNPELVNRIISKDGKVTAINVLVKLNNQENDQIRNIADFWRNIIEEEKQLNPNIKFYLTGQVMQNDAFGEATEKDASTLLPLSLLLIVISAGLYLRNFTATFTTTLTIIMSVILGLGTAGWLGIPITSPSASAPLIILTLAVADCIHLMQGYKNERDKENSKSVSLQNALDKYRIPIILTSLTTVVGFLTMNFSDSPPFRDLGNITAIGVFWAMILTLTFTPSLIMVLPQKNKVKQQKKWVENTLVFITQKVILKAKVVFPLTLVVCALIAFNATRNQIDDTLFEYFDHSYQIRQANDFTYSNITGVASIQFEINTHKDEVVSSPQFLNKLDKFVQEARTIEGVYYIQSITDTMKRLNQTMHGDDKTFYQIPDDNDLSAQILLLYEMSLPMGLNLNNQISLDKKQTRIIVTAHKMSSNELLKLEAQLRERLLTHFDEAQVSPGVSADIIFAHIGYNNNINMLYSAFIALLIISLLIGLCLKSLKLGLVSILPNILPAAVAFGLWGIFIGEVGLSISIVASMTLGIIVDSTIHLLYYYNKQQKLGESNENSLLLAIRNVGPAILGTTLILGLGFFVLSFSTFKMNADMGLMTTITLLLAIVLDFLLVPSLLTLLNKKSKA